MNVAYAEKIHREYTGLLVLNIYSIIVILSARNICNFVEWYNVQQQHSSEKNSIWDVDLSVPF